MKRETVDIVAVDTADTIALPLGVTVLPSEGTI